MRKLEFFIAVITMLFIGCASTDSFKEVDSLSPMAIVSITSNGEISWYGEEKKSSGLLGSILKKAVDDSDKEDIGVLLARSKSLLAGAETSFINSVNSAEGVNLLDKNEVIKSNSYFDAKSNDVIALADLIQPEGYKFVSSKDKKLMSGLNSELGAKSSIFVDFTFNKDMFAGVAKNGTAGARVSMFVKVLDSKGGIIFQKFYTANSEDSIPVVAGVYDPVKLMELFPSAINDVCGQFKSEFDI